VTKPCETCGAEMPGPPSRLQTKRWCRAECRPRKARTCKACGKPTEGTRKTCSIACWQAHLQLVASSLSTVGVRTPEQRAKRRREGRSKYRGKDKREVAARLTAEQRGRCAVCRGEGLALGDGTTGLVLDHDHETGAPRAMLCTRCNAAYGQMRESPDLIAALWKYAKRWAQRRVPHVA
jgi:hypothetical protein